MLRFIIDEAESAGEGHTEVVKPYNVKESQDLVVRFICFIHLDAVILRPLLLTPLVGPKQALGLLSLLVPAVAWAL